MYELGMVYRSIRRADGAAGAEASGTAVTVLLPPGDNPLAKAGLRHIG